MAVFVKAVESGSFSAAADALSMSSQLVGKHVRLLEQHLNVRLLNRSTRRQSLTDFGKTFYERARNILADVGAAEDLAAETRATPRGLLRISAPVTFGVHALSPKLPEYLKANPEVSIELRLSNRVVDVTDEGYDAVFRAGGLTDSGLVARELAGCRLILCAAPAYLASRKPIESPADLRHHECLGFALGASPARWDFEGRHGRVSVSVSSRIVMDSGEALLSAARAGLGIMLQPVELVQPEIEAGRLVALLPGYRAPPRPFHILYGLDRRPTPKLRSFIDFAVSAFGLNAPDATAVPQNSASATTALESQNRKLKRAVAANR